MFRVRLIYIVLFLRVWAFFTGVYATQKTEWGFDTYHELDSQRAYLRTPILSHLTNPHEFFGANLPY